MKMNNEKLIEAAKIWHGATEEEKESAGRQVLKGLISQCTEPQQELFKLMYGRLYGKRSMDDAKAMAINDVVDEIEDRKIDWAIKQCERTVNKIEMIKNVKFI